MAFDLLREPFGWPRSSQNCPTSSSCIIHAGIGQEEERARDIDLTEGCDLIIPGSWGYLLEAGSQGKLRGSDFALGFSGDKPETSFSHLGMCSRVAGQSPAPLGTQCLEHAVAPGLLEVRLVCLLSTLLEPRRCFCSRAGLPFPTHRYPNEQFCREK